MKMQLLTLSRKVAKSLSIASLVIASTFSLSFPSFAESLKALSLETSDFAVRLYDQGDKKQLYINIWKREGKGFYVANASPVQKVEFTQEEEKFWLEIGKIILPPLSNFFLIFCLVVALFIFICFQKKRIAELIEDFKITKLGVSWFEVQFAEAYQKEVYFKEADDKLLFLEAWKIQKDSLVHLHEMMNKLVEGADNKDKISVLKIELFPEDLLTYQRDTLEVYLETLIQYASMEYVIFTESDKFKGYIDAEKLLYQIKGEEKREKYTEEAKWIVETLKNDSQGKEIVSNINKYKAEKNFEELRNSIKGIVTYFIIKDSSNKQALEVIKKSNKPSLAVVDEEMSFIGFTNQEIIATQILNHLILNN